MPNISVEDRRGTFGLVAFEGDSFSAQLEVHCKSASRAPSPRSEVKHEYPRVTSRLQRPLAKALVGAYAWLATHQAWATAVVDGRVIADESKGTDWLSYGRTHSEARYSPLTKINDHNVTELGLAWFLDLPGQGTLEATPLAVEGVLYFSGSYGRVFAVDARRGRVLWEFDPNLALNNPQKLRLNMGAHRGVAFWNGKVYVGTNDGRLVALDAKRGKIVWRVQTVDVAKVNPKFISGAPRIFNGKVVIGHGSAEAGTRGYVTAYDAETGREIWRFYTVPGSSPQDTRTSAEAEAAKTWSGDPKNWGGGSVWDSIVYDPDFNRVYLATGNGNPISAAVRSPGSGDNLFLCSIVALDADTGRYIWHYQINPRDSWDYDSTQQIVLADLWIKGRIHKVLMQAPKNGFFYVIDRASGKLISAEKYAKATWAIRIDLATGRPIEIPNAHYENGPVTLWPSAAGAHNWQPMSFDPATGLVFIPTLKLGATFEPTKTTQGGTRADPPDNAQKKKPLYALEAGVGSGPYTPDSDDGTGALLAWDPVTQSKRWEVRYDTFWNGGTVSSAGNLVFQGTGRGQFIAYRASSGERLWSFDAGLGIIAAPVTYTAYGTQYVSILVGYGGMAGPGSKIFDYGWRYGEQPRRLLTFALGRRTQLPPSRPPRFTLNVVDDPVLTIDLRQANEGAKVYTANFCGMCHGPNLESNGSIAPDLRESYLAMNWQAFRAVLRYGTLTSAGMPKFDDLTASEMREIYMYIRQRARESAAVNASKTAFTRQIGALKGKRRFDSF